MVSLVFILPVFVPPCFVQTSDLGWGYGWGKEGRKGGVGWEQMATQTSGDGQTFPPWTECCLWSLVV